MSSGLIATENVDCHEAQSKGITLSSEVMTGNFDYIKTLKNMKILPMQSSFARIKVNEENVVIVDSETIFRRMLLLKPNNEDFENYINYELAIKKA